MVAVGGTPAPSGDLIVTWAAPASSGVGTINSYTATAQVSSGSKTCTSTSTAPATPTLGCHDRPHQRDVVHGLGDRHQQRRHRVQSVASAASTAAFPSTTFGAPTIGTATAGCDQATVSWTAPTALAGTQPALTGYVVTPVHRYHRPDAPDVQQHGDHRDRHRPDQRLGVHLQVAAINANGTGTYSAKSNSVTPTGTPAAPTNVVATPGDQSATVTWTDGSNEGSTTT